MIAGNALVEVLTGVCGRRTTSFYASSAVLAVAATGVGLVDSFWPASPCSSWRSARQASGRPYGRRTCTR